MELQKCLESRKSIRKYKDDPVAKETIEELIKAAQLAPSWKNTQVSRYYVAMGDAKKDFSEKCLPTFNRNNTENAPVLIVTTVVDGLSGFTQLGDTHLKHGFACFDNGLQVANLCLKATELGLGTLIMGIYKEAEIREFFNIPENETVVTVLGLGYPDIDPEAKPRKAVDEIVTFVE